MVVPVKNNADTENVGGGPIAWLWFQPQAGGEQTLLGRPIVVSEFCSVLGTEGDIVLADLSEYLIAMRPALRVEMSTGPLWNTNEISLRVVARLGGQPSLSAPQVIDGAGRPLARSSYWPRGNSHAVRGLLAESGRLHLAARD